MSLSPDQKNILRAINAFARDPIAAQRQNAQLTDQQATEIINEWITNNQPGYAARIASVDVQIAQLNADRATKAELLANMNNIINNSGE